jgi:hypothetical protein
MTVKGLSSSCDCFKSVTNCVRCWMVFSELGGDNDVRAVNQIPDFQLTVSHFTKCAVSVDICVWYRCVALIGI